VGMVVGVCWDKRNTNVVGYKESGLIWSLLPKKNCLGLEGHISCSFNSLTKSIIFLES
jgi:hypothetical protein